MTRLAEPMPNRARAMTRALVADQGPVIGLIVLIALTWTVFGAMNSSFVSSFNLYGIGQLGGSRRRAWA